MTTGTSLTVDVVVCLVTIVGWSVLMLSLEGASDRRVRWARFLLFGPFDQVRQLLPKDWGARHVVLVAAFALWLIVVVVRRERWQKLRTSLLVVVTTSLAFLAIASVL